MDESLSSLEKSVKHHASHAMVKRQIASGMKTDWVSSVERKMVKPQNLFITFGIGFLTKVPAFESSQNAEQSKQSSALMGIVKTLLITSVRSQLLKWLNRE